MPTEGGSASFPSILSRHNEDACLVHDGLGLYIVADGAGNAPAGEIAAQTAVAALEEFVRRAEVKDHTRFLGSFPSKGMAFDAARFAMKKVVQAAKESDELDGMATTFTMLLAHRERAVGCHVGDSRLYLARHGDLHQLTADHDLTIVPQGHSADTYDRVPIQCFAVKLRDADTFLLCTDGAEEVIEDPAILGRMGEVHPRVTAMRIAAAARRLNPERDATVVVVRVLEEDEVGWLALSEPAWPWAYGHTLAYAE